MGEEGIRPEQMAATEAYFANGPRVDTLNPIWSFEVKATDNGFIVQVGCKTFVAKDIEEVCTGMCMYYADVKAAVKKYCKRGVI